MRPLFEKVTVPEGASWALLDRRLDDGIPFQWHYHPEFELTLTLNSRGQRYIGDSIAAYDDGDLVLLGPEPAAHLVLGRADRRPPAAPRAWSCGSPKAWAGSLTGPLAEMRGGGGAARRAPAAASCSRPMRRAAVRPLIEAIPAPPPAERLLRLIEVLASLAEDAAAAPIAGPGLRPPDGRLRRTGRGSSASSTTSTRAIASRSRSRRWPSSPA